MKTQAQWVAERRHAAKDLETWNQLLANEFAKLLRLNDEQKRISMDLGEEPKDIIPAYYFEVVYKILNLGPKELRAPILFGTPDEIDDVVSKVIGQCGFYSENHFWIQL